MGGKHCAYIGKVQKGRQEGRGYMARFTDHALTLAGPQSSSAPAGDWKAGVQALAAGVQA